MEAWFDSNIETPAARVVDRILRGEPLRAADELPFARFIVSQDMRTPRARDELLTYFRAQAGIGGSKDVWLEFIVEQLEGASQRFRAFAWSRCNAPPGHGFITSDLGIVKVRNTGVRRNGRPEYEPMAWELGIRAGGFGWLVPLCPEAALIAANQRKSFTVTVSPEWLDAMNRQLAEDAAQYVLGRDLAHFPL